MKKLLIFDLDGTLLDTLKDLRNSVNFALRKCKYPERSMEEIRHSVGNGFRHLVATSLPAASDAEPVLQAARAHYQTHYCEKTIPYEGIMDTLDKLKAMDYTLAIVSNKPDAIVQALHHRFFSGTVSYAAGETVGIPRKPAPDAVFAAMRHFNASKEDTVYIGDSEVDYETAENAGVKSIIVGWGFRTQQELQTVGIPKIIPKTDMLFDEITSLW